MVLRGCSQCGKCGDAISEESGGGQKDCVSTPGIGPTLSVRWLSLGATHGGQSIFEQSPGGGLGGELAHLPRQTARHKLFLERLGHFCWEVQKPQGHLPGDCTPSQAAHSHRRSDRACDTSLQSSFPKVKVLARQRVWGFESSFASPPHLPALAVLPWASYSPSLSELASSMGTLAVSPHCCKG